MSLVLEFEQPGINKYPIGNWKWVVVLQRLGMESSL